MYILGGGQATLGECPTLSSILCCVICLSLSDLVRPDDEEIFKENLRINVRGDPIIYKL